MMKNLIIAPTLVICLLVVAEGARYERGVRGVVKHRELDTMKKKKKGVSKDGKKKGKAGKLGRSGKAVAAASRDSGEDEDAVAAAEAASGDGKGKGDDKEIAKAKEDDEDEDEEVEEVAEEEDGEGQKVEKEDEEDEDADAEAGATGDAAEDSAPLQKINISIQPAYHGIPVYLGVELGLYEAVGLEPNISVWTSGGPQVAAAVEEDAWDFGVAGSVPNIIAASQGISTVGISNDESSANQLVGAPGVTEFPPSGPVSAGAFAVSPGSTADLMLRRCMEANGVAFDDSHFLGGSPNDVVAALEGGNSTYGALWAPNSYVYLADNQDASEFCNGEAVGVTIPGGLMIRDEWGLANMELAAKALAVYLHGVTLMQNLGIRDKILQHARGFYTYVGQNPSDDAIERDFLTRPTFNLDALLGLMSRNFVNDNVSTLDHIYNDLATFLAEQGTIAAVPAAQSYLNDQYLQMISSDKDLRYFSYAGYSAEEMGDEVGVVASAFAADGGRKKA